MKIIIKGVNNMKVKFADVEEEVVTREEFPLEGALATLEGEVIAVLGYGSQGPGQAQNLRDNGFNVIVGQREGTASWDKAISDGWIPGETLFPIVEAAKRGTIISYLLSDASQPLIWPDIKEHVDGKTLYVSHGLPIHFNELTGIAPSEDTDIIMVAPKGAGASVRVNYLDGSGINASYAVYQDASGHALDTTLAMGIGIGAGYLFRTTCEDEVVSDHTGERAILIGELRALAESAYDSLRDKEGLSPEVAFMKSSEQLTQVILPSIGDGGSWGIYSQAQVAGELQTVLKYQKAVREAVTPLMEELYQSCKEGTEAKISLESNSKPDYREKLNAELDAIDASEMWTVGKEMRETIEDRTYGGKITNFALAGAVLGAMEAQYQVLIDHGHKPSEAANETIEETTQSLNQFYQQSGISELIRVCSTTAQRGALDWGPRFKYAIAPVFIDLEKSYENGPSYFTSNETVTTPNMWDVMETVRSLRPGN